jgi:hypothetical protein
MLAALSTLPDARRTSGSTRLPSSIQHSLDRRFGKWAYNETSDDVRKWFSDTKHGANPNLIAADFDGDGVRDYAVQIVTGPSGMAVRRVLVYLQRGKGYRHWTLATGEPDAELFLLRMRRGTKDYSYTRQRHFRYRLDTIGLFSEKGGYSYFYRNGKFVPEITSD